MSKESRTASTPPKPQIEPFLALRPTGKLQGGGDSSIFDTSGSVVGRGGKGGKEGKVRRDCSGEGERKIFLSKFPFCSKPEKVPGSKAHVCRQTEARKRKQFEDERLPIRDKLIDSRAKSNICSNSYTRKLVEVESQVGVVYRSIQNSTFGDASLLLHGLINSQAPTKSG